VSIDPHGALYFARMRSCAPTWAWIVAVAALGACGGTSAPHDAASVDTAATDAAHEASTADGGADVGAPDDATTDGPPPDDAGQEDAGPTDPCQSQGPLPAWVRRDGDAFVATGPGGDLAVTVYEPAVLRLRYRGSTAVADRSFAVVTPPAAGTTVHYGPADGDFVVCTDALRLVIGADGHVRAQQTDGTVLLEEPVGGGYLESGAARGVARSIASGEHFYGLGEKSGALDRAGRAFELWNTDAFDATWEGVPPGSDPLYQSIPFFVGLRDATAYGLFTDNSYRASFDFGATDPDVCWIQVAGGTIDQYLIAGPAMADVVRRYTWLTGRMPLPPRWTLGYHQSRWGYTRQQVLDVAQQLRTRRLPADGLWLDIQALDGFRSFTWDPVGFADPAGLVVALAGLGFKTTVIVDPGLKQDTSWDVYNAGVAGGHFLLGPGGTPWIGSVWAGPSAFPDFTAPGARGWWAGLTAAETDLGVRGLWIDMNEPTVFTVGTVPDTVAAAGDGVPTTMAEAHNVYALEEARATFDGLAASVPTRRPFVLTRAGFAGIQRYAAVWTGDAPSAFATLGETVPMLLGLGVSGVPFVGSDVGGYAGRATPELFARWLQVGAVSPFCRGHTASSGNPQEPWVFGQEVEDISRAQLEERYGLLPYLYSLFAESAQTGAPVLRPLVYEFQADAPSRTVGDEVMLGPSLLVAPVLAAGATTRMITLPPGRWFEAQSGAIHEGPATFAQGVTLAARPTFVRAGAIVPRIDPPQRTDETAGSRLYLDLYPGPTPGSFTLYEDDGDSLAYTTGAAARVTYTLTSTAGGATLVAGARAGSFVPPARTLVARVRRVDHGVTAATLDGAALPSRASYEDLLAAGTGVYYDDQDLSAVVAFPDRAGFTLALAYDPSITDLAPPVLVPVEVTVPAGTPTATPISIATSASGWAQQALTWTGPTTAAGLVPVPRGEWFDYKYTRGDWSTVEKWAGCVEATNRYGFGAAHPTRRDTVATWADWCP
jgi:alpha-glucosidase